MVDAFARGAKRRALILEGLLSACDSRQALWMRSRAVAADLGSQP